MGLHDEHGDERRRVMKKIISAGVIIILLSAGIVFAQMGRGRMMGGDRLHMPMTSGMGMAGMMGNNIVSASDGGVIVMSFNRLYKFDKDLKLVRQTDIPLDKEHIQNMMKNMRSMGIIWSDQDLDSTEP